ncbi:phytoene/squalene synthase family protein [Bdellovibrio bacteriovorus]|uniref:Phytoene synthase n=1 Tax=Bdellovibrio bacteriovorus (strain ATCC 15356 / DSM 50701 / NCIMB 9529 / HD100) TaxID=264462 RepID=Q6MMB1_BDEBA|nr:phytoene/squalene synthase family protein [Bdellovibrio bacteriovorus]CAE79594.1 phytoene synthase [Bdellovibrio bacteriovorus HD100]
MTLNQDLELHKQSIQKGSKSFALASLFFSKQQKLAAWKLYSWCRYCDDQIDGAAVSTAPRRLQELIQLTRSLPQDPAAMPFQFRGLRDVLSAHHIPAQYPLDLLRGMEMDVQNRRYQTLQDLEEYCYCVAGVVGLMMCHIMGVRSDQALRHAIAMGNAMQLTNICRDIREDANLGRCYLPQEWLKQAGMTETTLFLPEHRGSLVTIQERLLQRADELYAEGFAGLRFLSLRSCWAVLIAAKVYSYIGELIRRDSDRGLTRRIHVSFWKKIVLIGSTAKYFVPQVWWSLKSTEAVRPPARIWSLK